ncbi:MAG TPA: SpoIIIAC/SpoIIIAD family protein [Anaerovoracaceae bacterium]|nr:SpoIIIAC/SpoIIIAD family protein [Anaerovoracaceae bacterium]
MDILKIAALAMCAVVIITLVRAYKPEFSIFVGLACSILILYFIIDNLKYGFVYISGIYERLVYGRGYFAIIIKILAVAYITEFTTQLCIDSGEKAIGSKVELAGKVIIFYLAIPIFVSIMDLFEKLL